MIDNIYLNFGASAAFVTLAMLTLWVISLKVKDASIVDMFWGAGFGVIAVMCLWLNALTPYLLLLAALPIIWALRYTVYIVRRNWGHGEDSRYAAIRGNVTDKQWPLYSLRIVFVLQGLAMLIVSAPLWVAMATGHFVVREYTQTSQGFSERLASASPDIGLLAIIGTLIWLIGFLFEAVGDWQLARFIARRKALGAEVTGKVMDKGLWRYTRHPNYFGDVVMWWGIWLVACQTPWGWATIIGPLFITYSLVKLTGMAHLERTLGKRPEYADYMKRTSSFIPWFPKK